MQYGQIVFLLFIVLLLYYAVLIVLDIQKTKAAQAAEQDGQTCLLYTSPSPRDRG